MRALELLCEECGAITLVHPERQSAIIADYDPRYPSRTTMVPCSHCGRSEWSLRVRAIGFHKVPRVVNGEL